ncbi:glycosyltransferase family A protein [Mangrovimonas sp. TPBH4]|uniref:glycosyltransferase family 2 protein n=1 Tax=Mangrovimonas sp. TPBH4 TaxID=1645914 RepID=UPI0006B66E21|nr:glycosyltransferase family A protein [Mangrovimonas sp. TPBH4]
MINISIVISVYNKEDYLKSTIESVLNQTYQNFEIIAVNDGSSDNSLNILKGFSDSRLRIINQTNQGASAARNLGIKESKYEYIALLDGDDLWLPNYLAEMVTSIQTFPNEAVFASAIANTYDDKIVPVSYAVKNTNTIKIIDYFKNSTYNYSLLTSSSIIFKKEIIKKTGWYDTSIVSGQDVDFWIKIGLNFPVVFINRVLVHYRFNDYSLSNTTFDPKYKPKFNNYTTQEINNKHLKKFLDVNRYSLALMCKLHDYNNEFSEYKNAIDLTNLKWRHRIFLQSPKWFLKMLLDLKSLKKEKVYYKALNRK